MHLPDVFHRAGNTACCMTHGSFTPAPTGRCSLVPGADTHRPCGWCVHQSFSVDLTFLINYCIILLLSDSGASMKTLSPVSIAVWFFPLEPCDHSTELCHTMFSVSVALCREQ